MGNRKRNTPEQIASVLKQLEGRLGISEVSRLKALEDDNRRLKQLIG